MNSSKFQRFGKRDVLTPATPVLGSNAKTWESALVNSFAVRIDVLKARAVIQGYSFDNAVRKVKAGQVTSQDLASSARKGKIKTPA